MGFRNGKIYQSLLVTIGTLCLLIWIWLHSSESLTMLALLPAGLQCFLLLNMWRTEKPAALDSELKKVALLTFAVSLFLVLA
jgi:1,4-dihydroxy-2-naphthoate octaprenyltransferase